MNKKNIPAPKTPASVAKIENEKHLQAIAAKGLVDVLNTQSDSDKPDQFEITVTAKNKATKASASVTVVCPMPGMAHYREDGHSLKLELPAGAITKFGLKPAP